MKKFVFLGVIFLLAGHFKTGSLFGLEFSAIAGAGNLAFENSSKNPIGKGDFNGSLYPLGQIGLTDQLSTLFSYSVTLERDPLLRTVLTGLMELEADYFSLSVGPLFGLFTTREYPLKPGISARVGFNLPGIFFVNLEGGATFGRVRKTGDYYIETGRAALGFWLPNLISTLSVSRQKFTLAPQDLLTTEDELLRFCYRADIFAKNVPYTVSVDMGYQILKRSYDGLANGQDTFRAAFLGFETNITVLPSLIIRFGAEIPVYAWGKDPLTKAEGAWFFRAFAGFTWMAHKPNKPE
ncbi:hypothetical protein AGMMS50230_00980 [Spirochaetia bacterium]|nr:hypothetical protein AGMMS50230_00980 [Spirochaetia bacterium]